MPASPANLLVRRQALHHFDPELYALHSQLVQMAGFPIYQLKQAMLALDHASAEIAENMIAKDCMIDEYMVNIDAETMRLLGRECLTTYDLRVIFLTSKIAVELERIGNEIALFGRLIAKLFDPESSDPNQDLLTDIYKIANLLEIMLSKLMKIMKSMAPDDVQALLQYVLECEAQCQEGIKHQLTLVIQDGRMIRRTLDLMQMIKVLETSGENCRDIAQYIISMSENSDRAQPSVN